MCTKKAKYLSAHCFYKSHTGNIELCVIYFLFCEDISPGCLEAVNFTSEYIHLCSASFPWRLKSSRFAPSPLTLFNPLSALT